VCVLMSGSSALCSLTSAAACGLEAQAPIQRRPHWKGCSRYTHLAGAVRNYPIAQLSPLEYSYEVIMAVNGGEVAVNWRAKRGTLPARRQ
jgi:hypothetical protein